MRPRSRATIVSVCAAAAWVGGCGTSPTTPTANIAGSGHVVTEVRPVGGFTAVSVSGAGRLVIEQSGTETLAITAEDHILPLLRTVVVDGRLVIGAVSGTSINPTREILYRLGVRTLTDIEASGAIRVESTNIEADRLSLGLSGASTAHIAGTASRLILAASGASTCLVDGVRSLEVRAGLSGASYGRVRAAHFLEANVSGSSRLEYFGDPVLVANVSGSGFVRRIGP